tara:strand:- start:154 stop:966 length:813 start_codon:yes stop_codon:yes gene_type:complete
MEKIISTGLLALFFVTVSCVSNSEHEKALAEIESLKNQIDEFKNGESRLIALVERSFENNLYDSTRYYIAELRERHPASAKNKDFDVLRKQVDKKEAAEKAQNIAKAKEKERLANISNTGIWRISHYGDEFGNSTSEKLITNTSKIRGEFSNTATEDSKLDVDFLIDSRSKIAIMLYEYAGNNPVKAYSSEKYKVRMLVSGVVHDMIATNYSDRLKFEAADAIRIHNAFMNEEPVAFALYEVDSPTSKYSFDVQNTKYYPNAYRILTTGK